MLFLDIIVIALLVVSIVYCRSLGKKVKMLQDSKGEFAGIIRRFDDTIDRTQAGIASIKETTARAENELEDKLKQIRFLIDDVTFLSERAEKAAATLEEAINDVRPIENKIRATIETPAPKPIQEKPNQSVVSKKSTMYIMPEEKERLNPEEEKRLNKDTIEALLKSIAQAGEGDKASAAQSKEALLRMASASKRAKFEKELI